MSPVDLHPEDLLDRARAGLLSDREQHLLDEHLAQCATCRLLRDAPAAFDRELAAGADDEAMMGRLIDGAMAGMEARSKRRWWVRAGLLAAALLVVGAASAAAWRSASPPAPGTPAPAASEPAAKSPSAAALPEPPPSASVDLELDFPTATPSSPPSRPAAASAQELFAQANEARRQKTDAEAIRLYRELQHRFPESREAQVSRATLGQLLLDQKNPHQALSEFDGYLADGAKGAVTEEALVGRAQALQKLGRAAEERDAWQLLLQRYPQSVHAARARERLSQIK